MLFDINGSEFLLLILVAVVVIGPERLPKYAAQLGGWVRTMRAFMKTAKERVDAELGEQAGDVDWTALDPRRYDPRRIVREALLDDTPPPPRVDPGVRTYTSRARPVDVGAGGAAVAPVVAVAPVIGAVADPATSVTSTDAGVVAALGGAPFDDEAT
ncbi:MAG: twin-arginine translocase TatA/TatE family subunit [Cellulomonas sp.]